MVKKIIKNHMLKSIFIIYLVILFSLHFYNLSNANMIDVTNVLDDMQIEEKKEKIQYGPPKYNTEKLYESEEILYITGWIIVENMPSQEYNIFLVAKSDANSYTFPTLRKVRSDVTEHFGGMVNYDESGFVGVIDKQELTPGIYTLILKINDKEITTDRSIIIGNGD